MAVIAEDGVIGVEDTVEGAEPLVRRAVLRDLRRLGMKVTSRSMLARLRHPEGANVEAEADTEDAVDDQKVLLMTLLLQLRVHP